jgi:hypothetical protein
MLAGAIDADNSRIDKYLNKLILSRMRQDQKYDIVTSDEIILKFGSSLLKRIGIKGRRRISARMRLLAELLHTIRRLLDMPTKSLSFLSMALILMR